jgi:hypothetical protein
MHCCEGIRDRSRQGAATSWTKLSSLVQGLVADPPLARGRAVKVDGAVLHALVENGKVEAGVGDGFGEESQIGRAAGGAGGMTDLQEAGYVRGRKRDGMSGRLGPVRRTGV